MGKFDPSKKSVFGRYCTGCGRQVFRSAEKTCVACGSTQIVRIRPKPKWQGPWRRSA